ncbi:MAG: gluconate 2-dehydrogenase subunit 3 family protein [Stenomitos rutilans HA7619-LM2]|nr:gluconate 2-dehydrogenase subunit 3 family protein [Stenomitos rutilans HA7619-LM2]
MPKKVSRRLFVKYAGLTGAGLAGAATAPAHLVAQPPQSAATATPKLLEVTVAQFPLQPANYTFFTKSEAAFIEAAIDQLIPKDSVGPGALELNVAVYIDRQLASSFGNGEYLYLEGPFQQGTPQQGYQLPLRPREVYRIGIADVDHYCRASFGEKVFGQLGTSDQIKVLTGLEKGEITLANLPAPLFFGMLLQNTIEGYFADPIYGGNRDMASWKMLGFPGAHADFRDEVGKSERVVRAPIDLAQAMQQPQRATRG